MLTGATRGATACLGAMKAAAEVANARIKAAARILWMCRSRRIDEWAIRLALSSVPVHTGKIEAGFCKINFELL